MTETCNRLVQSVPSRETPSFGLPNGSKFKLRNSSHPSQVGEDALAGEMELERCGSMVHGDGGGRTGQGATCRNPKNCDASFSEASTMRVHGAGAKPTIRPQETAQNTAAAQVKQLRKLPPVIAWQERYGFWRPIKDGRAEVPRVWRPEAGLRPCPLIPVRRRAFRSVFMPGPLFLPLMPAGP